MKRNRNTVLSLASLILLYTSTQIYADAPRWVYITSNPNVTDITEDLDYYWVGTEFGLSRIKKTDYSLRVYHHSNSDIPSDHVYQLAVHPHTGDLWVATAGGICRFDGDIFHIPENIPPARNAWSTSLSIDSAGGVWVALRPSTYEKPFTIGRIDTTGSYSDILLNNPGFPSQFLRAQTIEMHADNRGGLWVHSKGGPGRYEHVVSYLYGGQWNTYNMRMSDLTLDSNDRLWFLGVLDQRGLGYISPGEPIVWIDSSEVPFTPQGIWGIAGEPDGAGILVQDSSGYIRFHNGECTHTGIKTDSRYSSYSPYVQFFPARNGSLLLHGHSVTTGLREVSEDTTVEVEILPFRTQLHGFTDVTCTPDGKIAAIALEDRMERLVTYSSGQFHSIDSLPGARHIVAGADGSLYLCADRRGGLLGIFADTLFTRDFGVNTRIGGDLAVDTGGILVFETHFHSRSYLTRYDPVQRERLCSIQHSQPLKSENGLVVARQNILWSCSKDGGLISYGIDDSTWTNYAEIDTHPFASAAYHSLVLDSTGHLWAATDSTKVIRFSPEGKVNNVFRLSEGRWCYIRGLCASSDGAVWLSLRENYASPTFACRIRNDSVTIFNSRKDPTMSRVESATVDTSGNVWFGTDRGVVVFNPDGVAGRPALPARKERNHRSPTLEKPHSVNIVGAGRASAVQVNLQTPARVAYTVFDSRGRTITSRETGLLPVGGHRLPIAGDSSKRCASGMLFVRVRLISKGREGVHTARFVQNGP